MIRHEVDEVRNKVICTLITGWWFGTFLFSIIYGILLPIDYFFKIVKNTNQIWLMAIIPMFLLLGALEMPTIKLSSFGKKRLSDPAYLTLMWMKLGC